MPSLKDLRNRIASTKATQKITKAMQMVAASKLRRAQAAAEAGRPYAQQMTKVLSNMARSVAGLQAAPKLLAGTGQQRVHLLIVCTADRGLCGAFNSSIVRLARERARVLVSEGREVKFFCVGRKGYDQLRRMFARQIIETVELRGVRNIGFQHAQSVGEKIVRLYDQGAFDVASLFFSRFRSVIVQVPTEQQIIPRSSPMSRRRVGRFTSMSQTRKRSWPNCCRSMSRSRCFPRYWRMPHRSRVRGCRQWTTLPATPGK